MSFRSSRSVQVQGSRLQRRRKTQTRVVLEALERRELLAYTGAVSGNIATLTGTGNVQITVNATDSNLQYSVDGAAPSEDFGGQKFAAAATNSLTIITTSGTNAVTLGNGSVTSLQVAVTLNTGTANDTLSVSSPLGPLNVTVESAQLFTISSLQSSATVSTTAGGSNLVIGSLGSPNKGSLAINGNLGDDFLKFDLNKGNPIPSGGLTFIGGGGKDSVNVVNGTNVQVHYKPIGSGSSNLTLGTDANLATFQAISQVVIGTPTANLSLVKVDASAVSGIVTLQDDSSATNGVSQALFGSIVPPLDFNNPANLQVDGGQNVTVNSLDKASSPNVVVNLIDGTTSVSINNTATSTPSVTINGTDKPNAINLSVLKATQPLTVDLKQGGDDTLSINGFTTTSTISVDTGAGANVVNVQATAGAPNISNTGTLTVNGGDNDDTLNLDYSNETPIPAAPGGISFDGGKGTNTVYLLKVNPAFTTATLNAAANSAKLTLDGVDLSQLNVSNATFDLSSYSLQSVVLNGTDAGNIFGLTASDVKDVASFQNLDQSPLYPTLVFARGATSIKANGGKGNDTLSLDFIGGTPIPAAPGGLTFDGAAGTNTVYLLNVNPPFTTATLNAATNSAKLTLDGVDLSQLNVSNAAFDLSAYTLQSVVMNGTDAGNIFGLTASGANDVASFQNLDKSPLYPTLVFARGATSIKAKGGIGNDTLYLDYLDGTPVPIAPGGLTFDGGDGTNTAVIVHATLSPELTADGNVATLSLGLITLPILTNVQIYDVTGSVVSSVTMTGKTTGQTFDISRDSASTDTIDFAKMSPPSPTLTFNGAAVNVTMNGSGNDTLNLNGFITNTLDIKTGTGTNTINLRRSSTVPTDQNLGNTAITGGAGDDTLNIDLQYGDPIPNQQLTFDGGIGNNGVDVKNGTNVDVHYKPTGNGPNPNDTNKYGSSTIAFGVNYPKDQSTGFVATLKNINWARIDTPSAQLQRVLLDLTAVKYAATVGDDGTLSDNLSQAQFGISDTELSSPPTQTQVYPSLVYTSPATLQLDGSKTVTVNSLDQQATPNNTAIVVNLADPDGTLYEVFVNNINVPAGTRPVTINGTDTTDQAPNADLVALSVIDATSPVNVSLLGGNDNLTVYRFRTFDAITVDKLLADKKTLAGGTDIFTVQAKSYKDTQYENTGNLGINGGQGSDQLILDNTGIKNPIPLIKSGSITFNGGLHNKISGQPVDGFWFNGGSVTRAIDDITGVGAGTFSTLDPNPERRLTFQNLDGHWSDTPSYNKILPVSLTQLDIINDANVNTTETITGAIQNGGVTTGLAELDLLVTASTPTDSFNFQGSSKTDTLTATIPVDFPAVTTLDTRAGDDSVTLSGTTKDLLTDAGKKVTLYLGLGNDAATLDLTQLGSGANRYNVFGSQSVTPPADQIVLTPDESNTLKLISGTNNLIAHAPLDQNGTPIPQQGTVTADNTAGNPIVATVNAYAINDLNARVFTVTNNGDFSGPTWSTTNPPVLVGPVKYAFGSLRESLRNAQKDRVTVSLANPVTIGFDQTLKPMKITVQPYGLPGNTPADPFTTIGLPVINNPITLDGNINGSQVELDGHSIKSTGLTIDGLTALGATPVTDEKDPTKTIALTIQNFNIHDFTANGISVDSSPSSKVLKNKVNYNSFNGIYVVSSGGSTIQENDASGDSETISNNGSNGILVTDSPNCQVLKNISAGNVFDGIQIVSSDGTTINENHITLNARDGLRIEQGTFYTVQSNDIGVLDRNKPVSGQGNSGNGITLNNVTASLIGGGAYKDATANVVVSSGGYGIQVAGGENIRIFGNQIGEIVSGKDRFQLPNTLDGIFISDQFVPSTVGNNLVNNNRGNGIYGLSVPDITIKYNEASNNDKNGILVEASPGSVIIGNSAFLNLDDGIAVRYSDGSKITYNYTSNTVNGISVTVSPNCKVLNNRSTSNGVDGITILSSEGTTISENHITLNTRDGLRIEDGKQYQVQSNDIGVLDRKKPVSGQGNTGNGITLIGVTDSLIGGGTYTDANANLVVSSGGYGIHVADGSGIAIVGNQVGSLPQASTNSLANTLDGIRVSNLLTGTTDHPNKVDNNLVGNNGKNGIVIVEDAATKNNPGTFKIDSVSGNQVQFNGLAGISISYLNGADNGQSKVVYGNAITNNKGDGLSLIMGTAYTVQSNDIGVLDRKNPASGQGNTGNGITLSGLTNSLIGKGTYTDATANVVVSSGGYGIQVADGSGIAIVGNQVGSLLQASTNSQTGLANTLDGIRVSNLLAGTTDNPNRLDNNLVGNNGKNGIVVSEDAATLNNPGAFIIDSVNGNLVLANGQSGIILLYQNGADNKHRKDVSRNSIASNGATGLYLGSGSNYTIDGNNVGIVDRNNPVIGQGNVGSGILLNAVQDAEISQNVVVSSGNRNANQTAALAPVTGAVGIRIIDPSLGLGAPGGRYTLPNGGAVTPGIAIYSNWVGVSSKDKSTLDRSFGNGWSGISIEQQKMASAPVSGNNNFSVLVQNNTIAANGYSGVNVVGIGQTAIVGNYIGTPMPNILNWKTVPYPGNPKPNRSPYPDGAGYSPPHYYGNNGDGIFLGDSAGNKVLGNTIAGNAVYKNAVKQGAPTKSDAWNGLDVYQKPPAGYFYVANGIHVSGKLSKGNSMSGNILGGANMNKKKLFIWNQGFPILVDTGASPKGVITGIGNYGSVNPVICNPYSFINQKQNFDTKIPPYKYSPSTTGPTVSTASIAVPQGPAGLHRARPRA